MTLLTGHLICALLTWIALVADGTTSRLTPRSFVRALRYDLVTFGIWRVLLWVLLCLTMWWTVWFAWMMEWLDAQRRR
jgi:hypothetical protein